MISLDNQKSIMAEARGVLAKSRRSSKKALAIFDLRYNNDRVVANSIFHISGQTGVKQQSVRLMIKSIWKAIFATDREFCENLYKSLYDSIDKTTGYAVNLSRLIEMGKADQNFVHIISDLLAYGLGHDKSVQKSEDFMRVLRRSEKYHLVYAHGLKIMENKSRKNSIKSIKRLEVKEYISSIDDVLALPLDVALKNAAKTLGAQGELFVKRTGLDDPKTAEISLQEQGEIAGGITRERVRQICENVMQNIMFAEGSVGKGPVTRIKAIATNQANKMKLNKESIIPVLTMIQENKELHCFQNNIKGFYFICRYAGIDLVKKKNGFWFVVGKIKDEILEQRIKKFNIKTVEVKIKPVIKCGLTKVDPAVIDFVKLECEKEGAADKSMNEYYVQCAVDLITKHIKGEPVKYDKVDWHDSSSKMVNIRFEGHILDKIDRIMSKEEGFSRADFLLTAIASKSNRDGFKEKLQAA